MNTFKGQTLKTALVIIRVANNDINWCLFLICGNLVLGMLAGSMDILGNVHFS